MYCIVIFSFIDVLHLQLTESNNQGHTQITDRINPVRGIPNEEVSEVPAIFMDDLLEVIKFNKTIMKIDIEGSEHRAMFACEKLLRQIYIPYIFMEWMWQNNMPEEQMAILNVMSHNRYEAFGLDKELLNIWDALDWPTDVIWKHSHASF